MNDRSHKIVCPLVTPFTDGEVDTEALAGIVEYLVDAGIDGLLPCGTAGEFAALTREEFLTVVETTVDAAGDTPVVAGTCHTAVGEVIDRVEMAADAGASGVMMVPPYYDKATEPKGDERFFRAIADASPVPMYLYNFPSRVGQSIDIETVVELADHDSVVGIKDTSGDMTFFGELLRRTPDEFDVYQGYDTQYIPGVAMGADGGIHVLAHVIPDAFHSSVEAVEAGDLDRARSIQFETIAPLFQQCMKHGFAPTVKAILAEQDRIPSREVRPPQLPLEDTEAVMETLDSGQETLRRFSLDAMWEPMRGDEPIRDD
ncbi:MAG: dihydrodipicolinate synthase family protein [Haloarculaceae archaeon]